MAPVARIDDTNTTHCGKSPLEGGFAFGRSDGRMVRRHGDPIRTHNIPDTVPPCEIPHSPVLDVPASRFTRSDGIRVAREGDGFTPTCTEVDLTGAFWRVG